jgi:biopolymer transport protein ExbB
MNTLSLNKTAFAVFFALLAGLTPGHAWWNKEWTARKSITVDTGKTGTEISEPVGTALVLLRLHQGNFNFGAAKDGGSDLRFIAEDDKTILEHQVEKWDGLMNEAFVWVKVPDIKPGAQAKFWLYFGVEGDKVEEGANPKETYDAETVLVYHFIAATPADATKNANNAATGGTTSEGALIGPGMRLLGNTAIKIPSSATFQHAAGQPLTLSAWVKSTTLTDKGVLFDWTDGGNRFQIALEAGVPTILIKTASGTQKSAPGAPVAAGTWKHLAVVATNATTTLYVDGKEYGKIDSPIPALTADATLGADSDGKNGVVGEIDEFEVSKIARGTGWVQFAYLSQAGNDASTKLIVAGEDEGSKGGGHNAALEHIMLFGDIAKNMMFDGWMVVFFCSIMALVSWSVALNKFFYLNRIQKGSQEFIRQWKHIASDLTALDHSDAESVSSLGGTASVKIQKLMKQSPLYHIYHIGSEEIRHRIEDKKRRFNGLSVRSIQAIKASLDSGLTHEVHRMNKGLIYLTISIAGGPYVGLLGTVMGVMITFAVIAKSGNVEVNSIAPGIASALLATVAGLLVAIPALFLYSYINARIKDAISNMNLFIDEFITKMAEFYPQTGDPGVPVRRMGVREEA